MPLVSLEIDSESVVSINRALESLWKYRFALREQSRTEYLLRPNERFVACSAIIDTDISVLYQESVLDSEPKYYVYAHLDTSRNQIKAGSDGLRTFAATLSMSHMPFYIGKGCGQRWKSGERSRAYLNIVNRIERFKTEPKLLKLREGLTESEALQFEAKLIDIFGLTAYGGTLTNLDEGHKAQDRIALYLSHYQRLRPANRRYSPVINKAQGERP